MPNKILVAVDGSEGGKRALQAAVEHARLTDSSLVLTYVIDWSPYSFHTPEELSERHARRESEIDRAQASVLDPEVASIADSGVAVESVVRHGKIAETLLALADEYNVSHIYVGKLGESRVHTMIFGSTTAAIVQTSTVPVTIVP